MIRPDKLGPYRIGRVLGKGGMGYVYAATHETTSEEVAIKALSPQLAMAEGFRERFEAEIESLRLLRHPGIVRLFGYGEEEGVVFYSMELVNGPSLEEELKQGRRFHWREVIEIAVQLCRSLKHAHDHGVIHRDLKPANILLDENEQVKLADFGIARLFGMSQLTNAGGVLGTADYMSPEQADGAPVTDRCDQYSLGCVMYALLAGRPPFRGKTLPEMLQMQRYAEADSVRRYAPKTPTQLEQVVAQLLAKSPADRFPNTLVLARHLEAMNRALAKTESDDFEIDPDAENDESNDDRVIKINGPKQPPAPDLQETQFDPNLTSNQASGSDAPSDSISLLLLEGEEGETPAAASQVTGAPLSDATLIAPSDYDPAPAPPKALFTTVDQSRGGTGDRLPGWVLATQGLLALLLLGGVAYGIHHLTKPLSADALHTRIEQTLAEEGDGALRLAADDVTAFVTRFANDPRAADLAELQDEIELDQLERRLTATLRRRSTAAADSSPAEQIYLDAMQLAKTNPAKAIDRLQGLAALLKNVSPDETSAAYATLASRQIERLNRQLEAEAKRQRPFLQERLNAAKELAKIKPNQAATLCEAIIALYSNKPWAEKQVEEAKVILATIREEDAAKSLTEAD